MTNIYIYPVANY